MNARTAVSSGAYASKVRVLENIIGLLGKAGFTVPAYVLAEAAQMICRHDTGYSNESFVAGCLFAAWKRQSCLALSIRQYCTIIVGDDPVAIREIVRCYRLFSKGSAKLCNVRPEIYVDEIARTLGVPARTRGLAMRIAARAVELKLHLGRSPPALAAAIVYLSCVQHSLAGITAARPTQDELARVAGCNASAIRGNIEHLRMGFAQDRWRRRGTALF